MANSKLAVIILTKNAAKLFVKQITGLQKQSQTANNVWVIDSSSTDNTLKLAQKFNCNCHVIPQEEFNHGATRQLATQLVDADFYIFMTHDALLANNDAIKNLLAAFTNPKVGCAYGRQLPNKNANILAKHARLFNYPSKSIIKSYDDRFALGIKTCFNSDSFAAYRKTALQEIGGFPADVILGEDTYVAAKMLLQGWSVAYQADAMVYHSHNYSIWQEFKRYFDVGVSHAMNPWIVKEFSNPDAEGVKYVKSELQYCLRQYAFFAFIRSMASVLAKYIGYRLGKNYLIIPNRWRRFISMTNFYWKAK